MNNYDDNDEIIPIKSLRKLNSIIRHNNELKQNYDLQQKLILWAKDLMSECRNNWDELHATSIDVIETIYKRKEAAERAKIRDRKYAPFRKLFKQIQTTKFDELSKLGKTMSANKFVIWFLENKSNDIKIPYQKSNLHHKLNQLAQENSRELKRNKPTTSKGG